METVDLISIISIAFLGSFGHCIGMCGGIVIAYSSAGLKAEHGQLFQITSHLLYSLGRVTTYTVLGALFGFLGGVAVFDNRTNGMLWLIAGTAMILTGLALLGKLHVLNAFEKHVSGARWYQDLFRQFINSDSVFGFYLLGLLNGLLPCGFVYFFAITAASTASPVYGALVMFVFGLSTIPSLCFGHLLRACAIHTVLGVCLQCSCHLRMVYLRVCHRIVTVPTIFQFVG